MIRRIVSLSPRRKRGALPVVKRKDRRRKRSLSRAIPHSSARRKGCDLNLGEYPSSTP